MLTKLLIFIEKYKVEYHSYALLRSVLALSTLLTIIINPIDTLFPIFIDSNEVVYSKLTLFDFNISYFVFRNIVLFKTISILILFLVIYGAYPRITGVLHFIVTCLFFNTSIAIDGGDQISSNLTFLLIPLTLLDNNTNHWRYKKKIKLLFNKVIFYSFSFVITLQISMVYLHSAIAKLTVNEWLDGTANWYWFRHEIFGANYFILDIVNFSLKNPYILYCLNYSVIILEILIAMMLFVDKNKYLPKLVFIFAIIFHIGIVFIHGIFSFALTMVGCLLFYFKKKVSYPSIELRKTSKQKA